MQIWISLNYFLNPSTRFSIIHFCAFLVCCEWGFIVRGFELKCKYLSMDDFCGSKRFIYHLQYSFVVILFVLTRLKLCLNEAAICACACFHNVSGRFATRVNIVTATKNVSEGVQTDHFFVAGKMFPWVAKRGNIMETCASSNCCRNIVASFKQRLTSFGLRAENLKYTGSERWSVEKIALMTKLYCILTSGKLVEKLFYFPRACSNWL